MSIDPMFIEKEGLSKALDGPAPAVRSALETELSFAQKDWRRHDIERTGKLLAKFDEMAEAAPFGQPDPLAFSLERRRLKWEYVPLVHHSPPPPPPPPPA